MVGYGIHDGKSGDQEWREPPRSIQGSRICSRLSEIGNDGPVSHAAFGGEFRGVSCGIQCVQRPAAALRRSAFGKKSRGAASILAEEQVVSSFRAGCFRN